MESEKRMSSKKVAFIAVIAASLLLVNGCVAIPPLINVTHKSDQNDLQKRLDAIDSRLNQIEKRLPAQ